jgi:adenylyltransferase/sulfurtransferase
MAGSIVELSDDVKTIFEREGPRGWKRFHLHLGVTTSDGTFSRYQRQMILPEFGVSMQASLGSGHAIIIGCGALGCVVADWLCRAGVGRLTIVDRDVVELGNLHRQVLFDEADAAGAVPKAVAAAERLARVNSAVRIEARVHDANARSIEGLLEDRAENAVVVDATDNFQTRYLLNDACVKHGLALAYAGVVGTHGMVMTILPGETPCLRCVFPEPPAPGSSPTCETAGVLGPAVGVIASMQAAEAIKVLGGRRERVSPRLCWMDVWTNERREIDVGTIDRSACPCCAGRRFDFLEGPLADAGTTALCGSRSVQVLGLGGLLDLESLEARLGPHGTFTRTRHLLRGVLKNDGGTRDIELTVFADGRAIVGGTQDPAFARSIYARYVG